MGVVKPLASVKLQAAASGITCLCLYRRPCAAMSNQIPQLVMFSGANNPTPGTGSKVMWNRLQRCKTFMCAVKEVGCNRHSRHTMSGQS